MNTIRYVEYNTHHSDDFVFDVAEGHDCWLLLLTLTPSSFWYEDTWHEVPVHSAILFAPNTKILYRACHTTYKDDWLRFDSDELFVSSLPIRQVPFPISDMDYCHNLFQLLTWEHSFPGQDHDRIINQLLHVLFSKLHDAAILFSQQKLTYPHYHELLLLRKKIYNSPQNPWCITQMSHDLNLSSGYLQKLYKNVFNVSCMEDVIRGRIRLACDKLHYSDRPIIDIAFECGYNNIEHFHRQFHSVMGISPKSYRTNCNSQTELSGDIVNQV